MSKKFKVIRAFSTYSVGAIIEPTGVYRSQLLAGKWIEPVAEVIRTMPAVEAAVMPVAETAAQPTPARRGRPRKNQAVA